MRHYSFTEIPIEKYRILDIEVSGGSRPRLVLEHIQKREKFFFKTYRHKPLEIWSEMLASQLGATCGVKIQMVSLKKAPDDIALTFRERYGDYLPTNWNGAGVLVRNVFPKDHEILYGMNIIGTASEAVTLERIESDIRSRYLDTEDILEAFADMVIFDAYIGNMDRHHENWAIGQKDVPTQLSLLRPTVAERAVFKKRRKFTPLYDHGSSLMFELDDNKVSIYSADKALYERVYILGKQYALLLMPDGRRANIFAVIKAHFDERTSWAPRFRKSIAKVTGPKELEVARMILEMPTGGLLGFSQERKELLYYSLRRRSEILQGILRNDWSVEDLNEEV